MEQIDAVITNHHHNIGLYSEMGHLISSLFLLLIVILLVFFTSVKFECWLLRAQDLSNCSTSEKQRVKNKLVFYLLSTA